MFYPNSLRMFCIVWFTTTTTTTTTTTNNNNNNNKRSFQLSQCLDLAINSWNLFPTWVCFCLFFLSQVHWEADWKPGHWLGNYIWVSFFSERSNQSRLLRVGEITFPHSLYSFCLRSFLFPPRPPPPRPIPTPLPLSISLSASKKGYGWIVVLGIIKVFRLKGLTAICV